VTVAVTPVRFRPQTDCGLFPLALGKVRTQMRIRSLALLGAALLAACAERAPLAPGDPVLNTVLTTPKVVINEVMADPSRVTDDVGEWIEVHNWGATSVDLQGWTLASNNDAAHTISTSVTVPAGGYVVLARNGTKRKNGGVTADHVYGTGLTLANGSDWLALRDAGGATVDSVAWSSVPSGATRGVKDASADNVTMGGTNWQTSTTVFGSGDKGTPGAANDGRIAPVPAIAFVTVTPGTAETAIGGTVQFSASATDAWGDPVAAAFAWSSSDAAIATVSTGGLATGAAGGTVQVRATAGGVTGEATLRVADEPAVAKLIINEVMQNPAAVLDDAGEWVEVHNWGWAAADLQGYRIASNNDTGHTIATSVVVPAGGYAVLAKNGDAATNGGVSAAYVYATVTLANSSDWVALRDPSGVTVDSVAWASVPTGGTRGVKDPSGDNTSQTGGNWVAQSSIFGAGDKGTPGARNNGYLAPGTGGVPATVYVSPPSETAAPGETRQLTATARDAGGSTAPTTFTWTSSNPSAATVDGTGLVTAVALGTATIRATAANGVWGEAALTVAVTQPGTAQEMLVRVLDIGQGDANLITNGTSRVLIDGGPDTLRFGVLLDSLGLNNTTIDVVILSHQHYDHHSGLRELFRASRNITVRYFFENKDEYTNAALQQLRDSVTARAGRGELVYRDTDDPCASGAPLCTVTMNGGAKVHVLRPNPNGSTPNNRSTPVKLVGPDSASFSMWFAGDGEHEAIDWFADGADYDVYPGMRVNVLKADHHGSCNGVKSRYVDLLNPDWVTFSLAAVNDYGHVHQQTKDLFNQYGRPWFRTDQNGTITIRTPGTPGGGYTITPQRGSSSLGGPSDRPSSQVACQAL
jgi:beta-lactamase superfamily II metal-dependent hydrolase